MIQGFYSFDSATRDSTYHSQVSHIASRGIDPQREFYRIPDKKEIQESYLQGKGLSRLAFDIFKNDFQSFQNIYCGAFYELLDERGELKKEMLKDFLHLNSYWLNTIAKQAKKLETRDNQSLLLYIHTVLSESEKEDINKEDVKDLVAALTAYRTDEVLEYCPEDLDFFILNILGVLGDLSEDFLDSESLDLFRQIKTRKAPNFTCSDTGSQLKMIKSLEEFLREEVQEFFRRAMHQRRDQSI